MFVSKFYPEINDPDGKDPFSWEPAPEGPRLRRRRIVELASAIAALEGELTGVVAEAVDEGDWSPDARHPSKWLQWVAGMRPARAHAVVAVAESLKSLPRIDAALKAGEISFDKTEAVCRIASAETQEVLLQWARSATAAQLSSIAKAHRRARHNRAAEPDADHLRRHLSYYFTDGGSFRLRAELAADDGAVFVKALDAATETLRKAEKAEGNEPPLTDGPPSPAETNYYGTTASYAGTRAADALVMFAETYLAAGPKARKGGERFRAIVHVDVDSLASGDGDTCELDGAAIGHETALRLTCDCTIMGLLEKDGVPLKAGRLHRTVSPSMRRVLQATDRHCRFPGCTNDIYLDAHHVVHWTKDGDTDLDNLALLCWWHHRLMHEGGYAMTIHPDRSVEVTRPTGEVVPAEPPEFKIPEHIHDWFERSWRVHPDLDDDWLHGLEPLHLDLCIQILELEEERALVSEEFYGRAKAGPVEPGVRIEQDLTG